MSASNSNNPLRSADEELSDLQNAVDFKFRHIAHQQRVKAAKKAKKARKKRK